MAAFCTTTTIDYKEAAKNLATINANLNQENSNIKSLKTSINRLQNSINKLQAEKTNVEKILPISVTKSINQ